MDQNIPKYINQLLYNHECVIISGLGAFISYNEVTNIDKKKNYFTPNKKSISFNSEIKKNDGLLANYISEIENISYEEACIVVANFTKNVVLKINNGEVFYFESIGNLKINSIGEIVFNSDNKINFDPDFFGLDSFYFPKINRQNKIIQTQYLSGVFILFLFISIGFFLSEKVLPNQENYNTASFNLQIKDNINNSNEVPGLYKISVSQIDYDLYKILGTNYHLSTKRCFKMGEDLEAHLKIYSEGKNKKRNLCFLNEMGAEFTDCYQIKNVYNQIPTSTNKLVVVDKKGKMRNAILVFEETEIDYKKLINPLETKKTEDTKDDIASRFLKAVKTLSENSNEEEEEEVNIIIPLNEQEQGPEKKDIVQNKNNEIDLKENIITNKNVFVIVGCFSSEKNAKNLVSQLNKKGFTDACIAGQSSNRKLFRVACSKFETEKEANKKLKKLKQEFEGAWVLNRD